MKTPAEPARRTYKGLVSDSTRWNAFVPRAGDIVVNTPAKAGTTWTQAIVAMLIAADPDVDADVARRSSWIDATFRPLEVVMAGLAAQEHRRQVKSHTPFDGLPWWNEVRYITVYRHPIDLYFSFRRHVQNMKLDIFDAQYPENVSEGFRIFLEGQYESSLDTILRHYTETLAREPRENLLRLHYADMLRDRARAVVRIAAHVGINESPSLMQKIIAATDFDSMKANADRFTPSAGSGFWHDDAGFFDSASCNKWEGLLSEADLAAYDTVMAARLTPEERAWLERGGAA